MDLSLFLNTVPTPTVSADDSTILQQEDTVLSCRVTLSSISLYSDNSFVMVTWTGPVSLPDRIFPVQSSVIDTRTISSISINSAGIYTCSANVFYNGTNMYVLNATSATDTAIIRVTSKSVISTMIISIYLSVIKFQCIILFIYSSDTYSCSY